MERIKIAQIGVCHEHAGAKMATLRALPEFFDVVGVVDDRGTASARFAGDDLTVYEGLPWVTEKKLLAMPDLQAVVIETPNADLVPTALRWVRHALPMHVDKPGGEDLALFRHLLADCREYGVPLQMGYMFRANPAIQFCLKAVREGWLGEIFEVQASMSHNYGGDAYQDYLGNFAGGIMFNLGCHLIDFLVAMLGRPTRITPFLRTAGGFSGHIRNNCRTVLEYGQAIVTIWASSLEHGGQGRRLLKICGTKGTVELCPIERFDGAPLTMRLVLAGDIPGYAAGVHTVDFGVCHSRYADQLLELAAIVRGEIANPWTLEHDELVQEVLLAAAGYIPWR